MLAFTSGYTRATLVAPVALFSAMLGGGIALAGEAV